jgi:hypothetical protein
MAQHPVPAVVDPPTNPGADLPPEVQASNEAYLRFWTWVTFPPAVLDRYPDRYYIREPLAPSHRHEYSFKTLHCVHPPCSARSPAALIRTDLIRQREAADAAFRRGYLMAMFRERYERELDHDYPATLPVEEDGTDAIRPLP